MHVLKFTVDWNNEEYFRYTAGRWLFGEDEQLSCRYVKFDMNELVRIATESMGSASCISVRKLPEGNYNKTFLLTMDDGKQVIARVPNPNAGRAHFTTASEVATMDFVRNTLGLPVPKVLSWSSRAADSVGAEYIIMEKVNGTELSLKWPELSGQDKYSLVRAVVDFERKLTSISFNSFGSLYYTKDIIDSARHDVLSVNKLDGEVPIPEFNVGPTTDRKFFDDGRGAVEVDRGPWHSIEEYVAAIGRREIDCVRQLERYPMPEGLFYGPGSYRPSPASKLSVLNAYLQVAKYILPSDASVRSSTLWHGDLHPDNIFVNPEKPTEIVGIIDWQSVHLAPLFLQARHPAFIEFEGPKPEGLQLPSLPDNFNELSATEQGAIKRLQSEQAIFKLYEIESALKNKRVYRALRYQTTLGCQIISLVGHILNDGEPVVKGQLIQVEREWSKVVGPNGPPCPLRFSSDDIAAHAKEEMIWGKGIVLMDEVLESLGGAQRGWNGWVKHEDYKVMKEKLRIVYDQFLEYMAQDEGERTLWSEAWPFEDGLPKVLRNVKEIRN